MATHDEPALAGQTLGAYTIERPLGAGGMGSVWLARRSDGLSVFLIDLRAARGLSLQDDGGEGHIRRR